MKKLVLILSIAVASLALAAPGLASPGEAKSVSVETSGLDLSSEAGVQMLYSRIKSAARVVCRGAEGRAAAMRVEHRSCMRTAVDNGVMAADNAALSALHLAKTGATATVAAK